MILTVEDVQEMDSAYEGICTNCGEIRDSCEPDAEGYPCDACGENAVVGALNVLFADGIDIVG